MKIGINIKPIVNINSITNLSGHELRAEIDRVIQEHQWELFNAGTCAKILWEIEQIIYYNSLDNPNRVKLDLILGSGNTLSLKPLNLFTLICLSGYDSIPERLLPEFGELSTYSAHYQISTQLEYRVIKKDTDQSRDEKIRDILNE